jgi:hypothetical protein
MQIVLLIIGWILALLMLPHFVAVSFARHVGVVLAMNNRYPSALIDEEVDLRAKRLGAAVIPYWIIAGGYWVSYWPPLRWVWIAYSILLGFMWFSGVAAVKRKAGL